MKILIYAMCLMLACTVTAYGENKPEGKILRSDERHGREGVVSGRDMVLRSNEFRRSDMRQCDGTYWMKMDHLGKYGEKYVSILGKVALVQGICEGAWSTDSLKAKELYYLEITYHGFVLTLDAFYQDKNNIKIPVAEAMKVVSMMLRNEKDSNIENEVKRLRAAF